MSCTLANMSREAIISPHLDDAVLSCWHRLEQPDTQVVTVFTGIPTQRKPSAWDTATGFRTPEETMNARIKENLVALRSTPSVAVNLEYIDHAYRDSPLDINRITEDVLHAAHDDAVFIAAAGVTQYLRKPHPDHEATRAVGKRLMELGRTVLFYADVPYILPRFRHVGWHERLPIEGIKKKLGLDVVSEPYELSEVQQARKWQAVHTYSSQFSLLNEGSRHALVKSEVYRWEVIFRPV